MIRWLITQMETQNLSQRELARRAGISQTSVSQVLALQREPTWEFCISIAHALRVPEEEVFRRAGLLPPAPTDDGLTPDAVADWDQLRRYVQMLTPDAQARVIRRFRELAEEIVDITQPDAGQDQGAA